MTSCEPVRPVLFDAAQLQAVKTIVVLPMVDAPGPEAVQAGGVPFALFEPHADVAVQAWLGVQVAPLLEDNHVPLLDKAGSGKIPDGVGRGVARAALGEIEIDQAGAA